MDPKLHGLPPHKRFRLIHHQQQDQQIQASSYCLPAKKRKETRDTSLLPDPFAAGAAEGVTYCLPAKKRVWALPPDLIPEKRVSSFDLNAEYKPSFEEEEDVENGGSKDFENTQVEKEGDIEEGLEKVMEVVENGGSGAFEDTQMEKENDIEEDCEEEEEDDGIVCAVCQSTDGEPSDPIVLCDGCDLMVHASCYGDPLVKGIPNGDWFCAQCMASKGSTNDLSFSCCLCPNKGGAMKPTSDDDGGGKWAHVVCALYVPEVFFRDPEGREGIDCSKVPKGRWGQRCYLCKKTNGCAINCSEPKCRLSFHVTCGLKEDLCIEYKEGKKKGAIVAGFCKTHTDLWKKQQQTGKFKIVAREE
ncbi:Methyltransferase [Parasponia andersonii]|uniref:Methyltransferase n=1 Tax=Parasponia andersonii TaxID=3476 RepID=A0A2P5D934_PARAD|nr:Methyltransferase [Parasponia andersonii]